MKRGEILDAVKHTITKDRNNRHGEPENSFPRIAEAWTDYLIRRGWTPGPGALLPSDVAEMLAIFKGVRFEIQPDDPDNEHDRIGYYAIAAELREIERAERDKVKNKINEYEGKIAAELREIERAERKIFGDKIQDGTIQRIKHPQATQPTPIEFPPYEPTKHGEIAMHRNVQFVAYTRFPKGGLVWVVDPTARYNT